MPMAAPMGAVDLGVSYGHMCSDPSTQHRAAFANAIGEDVERGMTVKDWQTGLTTTNRSARRLGRPST